MLTTEKAIEILPYMADIYDKLDLNNYRKQIQEKNKEDKLDQEEVGINLIKYVVRSAPKIKEEIFNIVAMIDGKTKEEIEKQSFLKTVATIKELMQDEEIQGFFK